VTSWNDAAGRTYASVVLGAGVSCADAASGSGRIHEPPLFVARIAVSDATRLAALEEALAGDGRPAGMLAAHRESRALVIELDPIRTPLALLVAIVDLETGPGFARRIEPLLPVSDSVLTTLCAVLLGEPALDTTRLIETYIEPMLAACP
jgi:hypothetical protein